MNDEELKNLWQQQPLRTPALSSAQMMSAMQKETTQLRRTLLARDVREILACVVVAVVFAVYFFIYRAPIARLGSLITVAGSIFIGWKILHTRRRTPPAKPDATIVESMRAELRSVRAQSQLLRSVLWWYLLPLAIGGIVFVWGMPFSNLIFDLAFRIIFTLFSVVVDAFIYWLNQQAVSKQLHPLEAQLESLLRSAETGEPLDEAQVTDLRPIALSIAAEHVEPAEFKVGAFSSGAFWRIALWGEIGFIGIWFFLMFALVTSHEGGNTRDQAVEAPAQTLRGEEANRYSAAARKIIDLLNARDYAAVQKLYSPGMSKIFPPTETSEFYTRLATRFGDIEKLVGPTGNGYRGWIAFRLHCQRGELTMSLALDADGKISGIYFQPVRV